MTAPRITARPGGRSFLSDIAKAGAGFATGLREEKERRRDKALQEAMQQFSMNQSVAQTKLGQDQLAEQIRQGTIQETLGNRQADTADQLRDIQRAQLTQGAAEHKATLAQRKVEAELEQERAKLQAETEIRKANIQARAAADRGDFGQFMQLMNGINVNVASRYDDAKRRVDDLEQMLPGIKYTPGRFKASLEKRAATGDAGAKDMLSKVGDWERARQELDTVTRERNHYGKVQRDVGGRMGIPTAPSADVTGMKEYPDMSPPEQSQVYSALVAEIQASLQQTGKTPDLDYAIQFGMPRELIEKAMEDAGAFGAPAEPKPIINRDLGVVRAPELPKPNVPQPTHTGDQLLNLQGAAPPPAAIPLTAPTVTPNMESPEAAALKRARMLRQGGMSPSDIINQEPNPRIKKAIGDTLSKYRL